MREWLWAPNPILTCHLKKIICTRPCFRVHAFASDQGDKGVCDAVSENHSSSCYNCDQWRVRKMRGGWTGRRRRCSEQGWELSRTVKSCHAWLWSWLTVGPLCFTDLLTACLVVFQEENRSPCRLHQKITSPKLSLSLSHPSFSPPCHMMALKHGYPRCPVVGPCDWHYSLISLLNPADVRYWEIVEGTEQREVLIKRVWFHVFWRCTTTLWGHFFAFLPRVRWEDTAFMFVQ